MKDLIQTIVEYLCDEPDLVEVHEIEGDSCSILEVTVGKNDLGKVIGKNGKTAQSIRNIIYACSHKFNKRYTIELTT